MVVDQEEHPPESIPEAMGEYLRRERERQGLTLEEVAEATKVRRTYLEALETGQYHRLPGEVYARGFLRNYAKLLHLPSEQLVNAFNEYWSAQKTEEQAQAPSREQPETSPGWSLPRFTPRTLTMVVLALAVVAGYVVVSAMLEPAEAPAPEPEPPVEEPEQVAEPEEDEDEEEEPEPEPEPEVSVNQVEDEPELAVFEVEPGPIVLQIEVLEGHRVWYRAEVDGETEEETLSEGSEREFEAEESIFLRLGNAGGLSLVINDEEVGAAGEPGQPRNLEITLSGD